MMTTVVPAVGRYALADLLNTILHELLPFLLHSYYPMLSHRESAQQCTLLVDRTSFSFAMTSVSCDNASVTFNSSHWMVCSFSGAAQFIAAAPLCSSRCKHIPLQQRPQCLPHEIHAGTHSGLLTDISVMARILPPCCCQCCDLWPLLSICRDPPPSTDHPN